MTESFDLIVIGAGSAARVAAERAAHDHGARVAMIERERWGGSCPNVACRPTKAYLVAAELGHDVRVLCANEDVATSFRRLGVEASATPLSHKLDVRGLLRLRPDLREAELLHTHDRRAGLLARVLGRTLGTACVHTFHGLPHEIAPLVGRPDAPLPGVSRSRRAWLLHGNLRIEGALARLGTGARLLARVLVVLLASPAAALAHAALQSASPAAERTSDGRANKDRAVTARA